MTDRLIQLEKLYDSDPSDPFITYGIALEHAKRGGYEQAIEWLDRTLGIDGRYCYAYFQKAKALSELGKSEEARRVAREGIETARSAGDDHAREELTTLLDSLA